MHFTAAFTTLALFIGSAIAAPSAPLRQVKRADGPTSGRVIVTVKDGASKDAVLGSIGMTSVYADWDILNAFVVEANDDAIATLLANPDVAEVEEDGTVTTFQLPRQTDAPWGLSRISSVGRLSNQNSAALTFSYTYSSAAGSGIDVYVVDTGVRYTHTQFGGRARWGATFGGYANSDGNGHGTHCAGTIAASRYGMAKSANIIAVKVLSDSGSGYISDVVAGLVWVRSQANSSGRPSVVSMSLGGGVNSALDNTVNLLTNAGVHVVVAAGNSNTNAANTSPARVASAITVGAMSIADARASFSNYGSVVDIFAPGVNVISTWATSNTATNSISGTSMATPHVAGLVATMLSVNGNVSPSAMQSTIKSMAGKNLLSGIPSGTVNYLARNFYD